MSKYDEMINRKYMHIRAARIKTNAETSFLVLVSLLFAVFLCFACQGWFLGW